MKFKRGLIWNYASLIVMALSGLLMNAIIVLNYDSSVLGVFHETYAWYIILSQIAVWGLHMAVVKYVPECLSDTEKCEILRTSLLLTFLISVCVTGMVEIAIWLLPEFKWRKSLSIAGIGLVVFSVNKVMSGYLNAIHEMIAYAVFTSIRYISFILVVLICSSVGVGHDYLALVFPVSEIIVFAGLSSYMYFKCDIKGRFVKSSVKKLIYFGTKILPSYTVLEMTTKVDVLCLGFTLEDVSLIGIYSFAILFTEGFYMLYVTIRKIVNPGISESNVSGKIAEYVESVKEVMKKYLVAGSVIGYVVLLLVFFLICTLMGKNEYRRGGIYISIICVGIALNGRYIIFGDLLAQLGFPLEESILNSITVISNFVLNVILIHAFGTVGAAMATCVSYFVFSIFMNYRVRERMQLKLK